MTTDTTPAQESAAHGAIVRHRHAWLEAAAAVLLVTGAAAGLVWHAHFIDPPAVDDAGTSVAYALTFFGGHGLRLTAFSQAVEGVSNPLWTLLLGLAVPLHTDPVLFAQRLGLALGLLGALIACLWGPLGERRWPRIEDALPALAAAVATPFAYWIDSGLETGLQVLLMALGGLLVCRQRQATIAWGVVFGLLALTHPEAILNATAGIGLVVYACVRERRTFSRREWMAGAVLATIVATWELVRIVWFASWLPNTYYAKADWSFGAVSYIGGFLHEYWGLASAAVILLGAGAAGGASIARAAWCSLVFLGTVFFFTWFARGEWMCEWRFLAPAVPFFGTAMAAGVATLRQRRQPVATAASFALAAGVMVLSVWVSAAHARHLKQAPEYSVPAGETWAKELRDWANDLGLRHPLMAVPDIGGFSLVLPQAEIIDNAGLADYAFARYRHEPRVLEDYLLMEGPPDVVNIHGPSEEVASETDLMARYMPPTRGYDWKLKGLTREEDPRCPGGKAAVLALGANALAQKVAGALAEGNPLEALQLWRCAFRYREVAELPGVTWRRRVSAAAARQAGLIQSENPEEALRYLSFATVASGGDAWLRRRTERLRRTVVSSKPIPTAPLPEPRPSAATRIIPPSAWRHPIFGRDFRVENGAGER